MRAANLLPKPILLHNYSRVLRIPIAYLTIVIEWHFFFGRQPSLINRCNRHRGSQMLSTCSPVKSDGLRWIPQPANLQFSSKQHFSIHPLFRAPLPLSGKSTKNAQNRSVQTVAATSRLHQSVTLQGWPYNLGLETTAASKPRAGFDFWITR